MLAVACRTCTARRVPTWPRNMPRQVDAKRWPESRLPPRAARGGRRNSASWSRGATGNRPHVRGRENDVEALIGQLQQHKRKHETRAGETVRRKFAFLPFPPLYLRP